MAVNGKIGRLCERIDALAGRRWGNLTMDSLTDEAWGKIERVGAAAPVNAERNAADQWSDAALLRFLVDEGVLTQADFRGRAE
jgi:hypothetical protein